MGATFTGPVGGPRLSFELSSSVLVSSNDSSSQPCPASSFHLTPPFPLSLSADAAEALKLTTGADGLEAGVARDFKMPPLAREGKTTCFLGEAFLAKYVVPLLGDPGATAAEARRNLPGRTVSPDSTGERVPVGRLVPPIKVVSAGAGAAKKSLEMLDFGFEDDAVGAEVEAVLEGLPNASKTSRVALSSLQRHHQQRPRRRQRGDPLFTESQQSRPGLRIRLCQQGPDEPGSDGLQRSSDRSDDVPHRLGLAFPFPRLDRPLTLPFESPPFRPSSNFLLKRRPTFGTGFGIERPGQRSQQGFVHRHALVCRPGGSLERRGAGMEVGREPVDGRGGPGRRRGSIVEYGRTPTRKHVPDPSEPFKLTSGLGSRYDLPHRLDPMTLCLFDRLVDFAPRLIPLPLCALQAFLVVAFAVLELFAELEDDLDVLGYVSVDRDDVPGRFGLDLFGPVGVLQRVVRLVIMRRRRCDADDHEGPAVTAQRVFE